MKMFDMLTRADIKRIKDATDQPDPAKRVKELENSLSIALEINDNYQRENKKLNDKIEELKAELARAKEEHKYDNLVHENELQKLLKK